MNRERTNLNENTNRCVTNFLHPCLRLLPDLSNRNRVYPMEKDAPKNSEFFYLQSKSTIRTIHIKPEKKQIVKRHSTFDRRNPFRSSLSEEYWFTKCDKPLQHGSCHCSFRNSQRVSKMSSDIINLQMNNCKVRISVKIVNIETYIERLMQETFLQAFQEYFILKGSDKKNGLDNLGYLKDFNDVVLRRKDQRKSGETANQDINKYTFTVNKSCVHRKDQQQKEKPLIILFHGIGCSADVWSKIIDSLISKGYEVVAPDMLGHGYSSTPKKSKLYSFKNLLNNAVALFDHYVTAHASQSCIIIGHSFGCSIATALYRFRPQQILQLILISGGGPTPLAATVRGHEFSQFNCAEFFFKPLLVCGLKRRFFYSSRGKHFVPCTNEHAVPNFVIRSIAFGQNWPEGDAAYHRRILVPTLLVHGLQDKNITLVQECEMERTMPRAFLELIPDAGHMVMLDTPEQLAHMILCFIDWWSK